MLMHLIILPIKGDGSPEAPFDVDFGTWDPWQNNAQKNVRVISQLVENFGYFASWLYCSSEALDALIDAQPNMNVLERDVESD